MQEPKYFKKRGIGAMLMLPLSLVWSGVDRLRRRFIRPYKSRIPVICVGNAVLGGVGKTPIVIEIARELMASGLKVAILSRGYRGRVKGSKIVRLKDSAYMVGDEAKMMADKLPDALVVVGANRGASARLVERKADVIIMDDGLQNYTLCKDFNICVFDAKAGVGNRLVFPAGPLRQSLGVVMSGIDAAVVMNGRAGSWLGDFKPVFEAKIEVVTNISSYRGRGVVAMAGIGRPGKFFEALSAAGVKPKRLAAFPDHHDYVRKELVDLAKPGVPVLTTEKDYVKIPPDLRLAFVPVEIRAVLPAELVQKIICKISES